MRTVELTTASTFYSITHPMRPMLWISRAVSARPLHETRFLVLIDHLYQGVIQTAHARACCLDIPLILTYAFATAQPRLVGRRASAHRRAREQPHQVRNELCKARKLCTAPKSGFRLSISAAARAAALDVSSNVTSAFSAAAFAAAASTSVLSCRPSAPKLCSLVTHL